MISLISLTYLCSGLSAVVCYYIDGHIKLKLHKSNFYQQII
mgnify:CR=1 FL=1